MATNTDKCLRVRRKRIELIASHNREDLVFLHPIYGPNTYANVGSEIERDGLYRPTMAETASLVHGAFNSDDDYSKDIKKIMRDNWLWGFTGILYVPNRGAYIQDDPELRNGMPYMEELELIKRLESGDSLVRYVPFGFKIGSQSSLELSKNPYVIGLVGKEGVEKLAEVADKHRAKPYLWSFESVDESLTRVSALDSYWSIGVRRLNVYGYIHGNDRDGCAFGVQKAGEASIKKSD